jgi:hypothetical protein
LPRGQLDGEFGRLAWAGAGALEAVAAAFGLSALFAYSAIAFDLIKYCGATYLVYLGVSGFLKNGIGGIIARCDNRARSSLPSAYWQGFLTDLFNPKLLLFFFSFQAFWGPAQARVRAKKKPGFPRLSRQWSAPAYSGASLKERCLRPEQLHPWPRRQRGCRHNR